MEQEIGFEGPNGTKERSSIAVAEHSIAIFKHSRVEQMEKLVCF